MNRNSKLWSFLLTYTWPLFNNNPEKFQTNDQVDDIYPFERKTAPIKLVRIHSPSTAALFTAALFTAVTGVIMNRSSNYSDNGRGCKLLGLKATYTPRLCVHNTMRYRDVPVGTCSKRCCIVLVYSTSACCIVTKLWRHPNCFLLSTNALLSMLQLTSVALSGFMPGLHYIMQLICTVYLQNMRMLKWVCFRIRTKF